MRLYKSIIGIIGIEVELVNNEPFVSEIKFISSDNFAEHIENYSHEHIENYNNSNNFNNDYIKSYDSLKKKSDEKLDFQDKVFIEIAEYLSGLRVELDFPILVRGTPFQKSVWSELQKIPYGETRSYKDISIAIGNEKACRAVGGANNKNKLPLIIPCHRVIGRNGKLVGFAGGLDIKEKLLQIEISFKK